MKAFLIILAIVAVFFLVRLPNLTLQPIFADEAIYIRWAQVMRAEPGLRFVSVTDGKTPLYMWTLIPLFKVFSDPLFAGRFLSVLAGLSTLAAVFLLSRRLFSIKVAFWSSLIYAVTPYTVFFDRMALVDSMLASFTLWAIYFATWLIKKQRLDLAMILGYFLGGAILVKTPAMMNLLALPVTVIGFNFKNLKVNSLVKLFVLWGVAIVIALVIYNLLRLGPEFQQLSARNSDYIFTPHDLIGRPLDPFIPHLRDVSDWFPKLLTWPILVSFFAGVWFTVKTKNRVALSVLLWALVPFLLQLTFLRTFTARYLLFSIPPMLVLAGFGLSKILDLGKFANTWKVVLGLFIILPLALHFDYQLLKGSPPDQLPRAERIGYFEDWTAGYGFKEIAEFLVEEKKNGSVLVGTEGYFGTLPDGLAIYLDKSGIPIIGDKGLISDKLRDATKNNKVFFIANKNRLNGIEGAKFIKEYLKVKPLDNRPQDAIVVYQVLP